jgi:hypothetical protein
MKNIGTLMGLLLVGASVIFSISCASTTKKTEAVAVTEEKAPNEPTKTETRTNLADLGAASAGRSR